MELQPNSKIELKEIADYRGNLSFAEEQNPIPFDIKSVFWTTIGENQNIKSETNSFIIVLDGKIDLNSEILEKPNQGYYSKANTILNINLLSKKATILWVMDKVIVANDNAKFNSKDLLQIPFIKDFNGLSGYFANSERTLPLNIRRVYYTYNIPDFAHRGGHAHINTSSFIVAIKGGFDISLDDGIQTKHHYLSLPSEGLFIDKGLWRELSKFKDKTTLLVFTSDIYREEDYIRKYQDFKERYLQ